MNNEPTNQKRYLVQVTETKTTVGTVQVEAGTPLEATALAKDTFVPDECDNETSELAALILTEDGDPFTYPEAKIEEGIDYYVPCVGCGEVIDSPPAGLYPGDQCGACLFWEGVFLETENLIIDGTYYRVDPEASTSASRGYGGERFVIQKFDGTRIETTNLRYVSAVPERLRARFPDTATFVDEDEDEFGRPAEWGPSPVRFSRFGPCECLPAGAGNVTVRGRCRVTREVFETPPLSMTALERFEAGEDAQSAFPELTPGEREFLISGFSPKGWKRLLAISQSQE